MAKEECQFYNDIISAAKDCLADPTGEEPFAPSITHIRFDFAQQIELLFHISQVGPLYFKFRFRVQLFGICNEAAHRQRNYLFHEGQCIGEACKKAHGPNAVISTVDHYLDTTLDVADVLHMHADNCVGQNKNNTTIAYPVWRTLTGLSMRLELSFMSFGHTRCTVDGHFGLPKTKVRNSDFGTMTQVVAAVEVSSHVNEAQVFDWQWREWDAFLMRFITPIRGITKFHHFRVENTEPGMVYMKESVHEVEQVFCIL